MKINQNYKNKKINVLRNAFIFIVVLCSCYNLNTSNV